MPLKLSKTMRARRSLRLHASFISSGFLCFDVGAHVGDRIRVFRKLGARVVAVEPQPRMVRELRATWRSDRGVTVEAKAVGPRVGTCVLRLNRSHSTLASVDEGWQSSGRFASTEWGESVTVPMTTLDELIAAHGIPDFCKIDVEGYEREVLRGLTRPLPLISFEFTIEFSERARECFDMLAARGPIEANVSLGEPTKFEFPTWTAPDAVLEYVESLGSPDTWGDFYARSLV